jgi:hypothetical protein
METPMPGDQGVLISATGKATFVSNVQFDHPVQAIVLTLAAERGGQMSMMWANAADPEALTIVPFTVRPGLQTVSMSMDDYAEWKSAQVRRWGIMLPPGMRLVLQEIQFQGWSTTEQLTEAFKSFWQFDTYLPTSINFLWGPSVTFNPIGTRDMHVSMPPKGRAGMWILLIVGGVAMGAAALEQKIVRKKIAWTATMLCVVAGVWMTMDIRMGTELLSYVVTDVRSYVLPEPGRKFFRNYANLTDAVNHLLPLLKDREQYIAIGPEPSPFFTLLRYYTYPHLPVHPNENTDARTWLIFDRSDVTVDATGRLTQGSTVLSPPGKATSLGSNSFIFTTTP